LQRTHCKTVNQKTNIQKVKSKNTNGKKSNRKKGNKKTRKNWATGKLGNEEWGSRKKNNTKLMSGSNSTLTFEPPEQQP